MIGLRCSGVTLSNFFVIISFLGFWVLSMAFTLPLAKAAKILAPERPTSSLLGAYTMSSVLGVLALNVSFTAIAMAALYHQDWYQCRKYAGTDVSNVLIIGDNYESTVLFVVVGYQFISSAMTFNFGYNFREGWFKNHFFVALCCLFTILHFYVTLVPGKLSCMFRVNCLNEVSYHVYFIFPFFSYVFEAAIFA